MMIFFMTLLFCIGNVSGENRKSVFIKFLSGSNIGVSVEELKILGEELDSRIVMSLDKSKYRIMSRRDVEVMLQPGMKIEECDGKCDVEIGRMIQADLMINIKMSKGFGRYFVYVNVIDTKRAEVLNKITISTGNSGKGLDSLFKEVEEYDFRSYLFGEKIDIYEREEEEVVEEEEELSESFEKKKVEVRKSLEKKEVEIDDLFDDLLSGGYKKVSLSYVNGVSRLFSRHLKNPSEKTTSSSGKKLEISVLIFLDRKGHIDEYHFQNYDKDDVFSREILRTIRVFSAGKNRLPLPKDLDERNTIWTRGINLMFSF